MESRSEAPPPTECSFLVIKHMDLRDLISELFVLLLVLLTKLLRLSSLHTSQGRYVLHGARRIDPLAHGCGAVGAFWRRNVVHGCVVKLVIVECVVVYVS